MGQNPTTQSVAIRSADSHQYALVVNSDGSINVTATGTGQAASAASVPVVPASDYFPPGVSYKNITAGQATTVIKASAGVLYAIVFNGPATATNTTNFYDNASGAGTIIATPLATAVTSPETVTFGPGVIFANGLTVITATANGANMTVIYR